jgi:hypothetical protein
MRFWYIVFILTLSGCYSAKKAERDINKAKVNYPDIVAEKFADWYGCDTVTITRDSIQFKEWVNEIHSFDTIVDTVRLKEKCPDLLVKYREIVKRVPPIHDTIKIKDRAELDALNIKYESLKKEYDGNQKLTTKLSWFALFLLIILLIIAILKK